MKWLLAMAIATMLLATACTSWDSSGSGPPMGAINALPPQPHNSPVVPGG